jgi:hypothetical protein
LSQEFGDDNPILHVSAFVRLDAVEFGEFGSLESEPVHAEADANLVEVAREGAILSQFADLSEAFKERFLRHVLGFVSVSQQVSRRTYKTVSMSGNQHAECVFVSLAASSNPLSLLRRLVYDRPRK